MSCTQNQYQNFMGIILNISQHKSYDLNTYVENWVFKVKINQLKKDCKVKCEFQN